MKKILTLLAIFMVAMTVNAREPITSEWDLTTFETKFTKESPITENLDDYIVLSCCSYSTGWDSGASNYSEMKNGAGWKSGEFDVQGVISIQPQTGAMLTYVELTFQDVDHSPSTYAPTSVTPDGSEIVINENKVTWSGKILDGQFTLQFTSGNLILTKIKVTYQCIWELVEHERTDYQAHEYSITNGSYTIETDSPDNTDLTISNDVNHNFQVLPDTPFDLDLTDPVYLQNSTTQYQIVAIDATGLTEVKMRSIVLPASLTTLGGLNFCDNLSSVTFEEGSKLKEILAAAFCNCPNLESLSFPKTLEYLSGYVFAGNNTTLSFKSLPSLNQTFEDYGQTKFTGTVNVELTDDSYIYTGNQTGYTTFQNATSIDYTRTMANQWGTIVLPYPVVYNSSNGSYKLYALSEASSSTLTFTEYADGTTIAAGTPMAIKAVSEKNAEGKYTVTIDAGNASAVATNRGITATTAVDGFSMNGTFVNIASKKDVYFIAQDKFWWAETAISIAPFRAWFETTNSDAKAFNIVVDDEADGISLTPAISEGEGVCKYLENGKVVIVKNGKKFNLNGQAIK